MTTSKISTSDGIKHIISEWNALRYGLGRIVQVKTGKIRSTSDCVGFVWSGNGAKQRKAELLTIEDRCKTSNWSDEENSKLQGPERCCGKGMSHQESKRKESLRWEETGRVFSVEGTWTMFQRRLMKFQSWHTSAWKQWQRFRDKKGRSSSPAFHSKAQHTYWRRGTKITKGIRQHRGKLFGQEWNSRPIQVL